MGRFAGFAQPAWAKGVGVPHRLLASHGASAERLRGIESEGLLAGPVLLLEKVGVGRRVVGWPSNGRPVVGGGW